MNLECKDYRDFLSQEFSQRCKRNESYSLRAFARDLDFSIGSLSKVLLGKQGLSLQKAKQIALKLQLSDLEKEFFCNLVESRHARAKAKRDLAIQKLGEETNQVADLSLDYFRIISDWHHYAILELTTVKSFQSNPAWIGKRLGISEADAKEAVSRLMRLELLEKNKKGKWVKTNGFLATPSGVAHRSLKNHHTQLLKKAETALHEQSVEERDFSNITFAMNAKNLDWAKEELKKFRRKLTQRLAQQTEKDRIYQLSMQLFAIDLNQQGEKNEK